MNIDFESKRLPLNKEYCFKKNNPENRWKKQLGCFGEQLVMTLLARMKGYHAALVDHEGADLIAFPSDAQPNQKGYAISVKARQFGYNLDEDKKGEDETFVFEKKDQEKLTQFALDFDLIPAVAMVFITADFSYMDVYLMTLSGFRQLAINCEDDVCREAIKFTSKGIQINNYSLDGKKKQYCDRKGFLNYFHNTVAEDGLIDSVRFEIPKKFSRKTDLANFRETSFPNISSPQKDGNLSRQFGDFGEHLVMYILGHMKGYKVACVDYVGADLIATDTKGKRYAISVKSVHDEVFSFDHNNYQKLVQFSQAFNNMEPVVAIVFSSETSIDVFIVKLTEFERMAIHHEVGFDTHAYAYRLHSKTAALNQHINHVHFNIGSHLIVGI